MRYFYNLLLYLASPFILFRQLFRSLKNKSYRERIGERFGIYSFAQKNRNGKSIWVHVVSVGETIAAAPLIYSLINKYKKIPIIVTTMTPTGAERVKKLFGKDVEHFYIPYDFPGAVNRFIKNINPVICIIFETELWPNLLATCKRKQIPVCLLNARLSQQSACGYQRVASLTKQMMKSITHIAAVNSEDAARFNKLGAPIECISVTGNIKFDLAPPVINFDLRKAIGNERFVWIAASTHQGEDEIIIAAHRQLLVKNPDALLILVPRHHTRFDAVAKLCTVSGFKLSRHSRDYPHLNLIADTAIYLGDTIGDLMMLYASSDVAFVGGSLVAKGGHNMIEPALLGKPLITGPSTFNFAYESELFYVAGGLIKVKDAETLYLNLAMLLENIMKRTAMGNAAQAIVANNRGALDKQLRLVTEIIPSRVAI